MLQVDASQVGAGVVEVQSNDQRVMRPLSFYSKKLNNYQLNYSVIEKEALSLIWALQHFDVYVGAGGPTLVYADHIPLTFLYSLFKPEADEVVVASSGLQPRSDILKERTILLLMCYHALRCID